MLSLYIYLRNLRVHRGLMLNTEYNIKELNQGALCITSPTILPPLALPITLLVENPIRQPRYCHVLAAREKGADLIVEDIWIAFLVHAI